MSKYLKVKEFRDDTIYQTDLNEFLKQIREDVYSVTSFYNTVLGGLIYVVLYWDQEVDKSEPSIKSDWSIEECFKDLSKNGYHRLNDGDIRLTPVMQEQICDLVNQFYTKNL